MNPDDEAWQPKLESKFILSGDVFDNFRQVTDPKTTAGVLLGVAEAELPHESQPGKTPARSPISRGAYCTLEAIAFHPNTPPSLLAHLIAFEPRFAHAFCYNPIAPLVLLEMPDFPLMLPEDAQLALLCEAKVPRALLALIQATNPSPQIQEAARLHVSVAGEMAVEEWPDALRGYFAGYCASAQVGGWERQWHFDMIEVGLAPRWAQGHAPLPLPISHLGQHPWINEWFRFAHVQGAPEERLLLDQINPINDEIDRVRNGLRADATVDDLTKLAHLPLPKNDTRTLHRQSLVMQAVLCHPNANDAVRNAVAAAGNRVPFEELKGAKPVDAAFVRDALQNEDPVLRRAARRSRTAPPDALLISRAAYATVVENGYTKPFLPLVSLAATLHFVHQWKEHTANRKSKQLHWTERLEAVLVAAAHPDVLHGLPPSQRTSAELIKHLTYDGNRIVRAAAKTYLANPNYRFVLGK